MSARAKRICVDVGGTFTDCLVMEEGGLLQKFKAFPRNSKSLSGNCIVHWRDNARKKIIFSQSLFGWKGRYWEELFVQSTFKNEVVSGPRKSESTEVGILCDTDKMKSKAPGFLRDGAVSTEKSPHRWKRRKIKGLSVHCLPEMRASTTDGSARVEVSPKSVVSPSAIFLKILRMIFPLRVLGRASAKWILSGVAIGPISFRT